MGHGHPYCGSIFYKAPYLDKLIFEARNLITSVQRISDLEKDLWRDSFTSLKQQPKFILR